MNSFEGWTSKKVEECQICGNDELNSLLFLGYMPPVNQMRIIGEQPNEQPSYPAEVLSCSKCSLVQLGITVNPTILFPKEYPYTSSTTRILRENFAELYQECSSLIDLSSDDLIVDIGSNDGNLLSNFKDNHKVLGVTPEDICKIAIERGVPTIQDYFKQDVVEQIKSEYSNAKVITATNVFAHIDDPNLITELIVDLLTDDGVFISESHYLAPLVETLQYDTVYHEHLRYYSLHSLKYLLEQHGLEVFHAKEIPTHGGSIRVYATQKGQREVLDSVSNVLENEKETVLNDAYLEKFKQNVLVSKLELHSLLLDIKKNGEKVYGIGAPSRASTLINYVGLEEGMVDAVMEISGSYKIGKYMPGTLIPVLDEKELYENQPEYALLLSWHIADELIPILKNKGFKGKYIVPLPTPKIIN